MVATPEPPQPTSLELPDHENQPAPQSTGLELPSREAGPPEPVPPVTDDAVPASPDPATPLGDLVAAHLQRLEVAMLSRILATTLAGTLPPSMVRVERRRTLTQRLSHRPGVVIGVSISAQDKTLTFRTPDIGVTEATVSHTIHGVVLSNTQVTVSEWLDQLAEVLNTASDHDAATRAALQRALLA